MFIFAYFCTHTPIISLFPGIDFLFCKSNRKASSTSCLFS